MSTRGFRFLTWGIVAAWVSLFSIHLYRHYVSGVAVSPVQAINRDTFKVEDQWFGLYRDREKIGHMHTTTEKIGDEYRFSQYVEMTLGGEGRTETVKNNLSCLSDSEYRIKSFDFESDVGGSIFKSHGEFKDDRMVMFMEKEGEHRVVNKELKEHPYFPLTLKAALLEQGLMQGKKIRFPVLDFLTLKVIHGTAEVEEILPVKAGINVFSAYRVALKYPGIQNRFWISNKGFTLREELPQGILVIYEPEEIAKSSIEKERFFDYLMVPTIKSNQIISEPAKVRRMKVRLSGIDSASFPDLDGGYQTLSGDIVEIRRFYEKELEKESYELPYIGGDLQPYLEPTVWIQSDEPKIKEFSKAAKAGLTDAAKVAGAFTGRMYSWINKQPTARIPTAMDAYKLRIGESLEHTVLYTAMARTIGIPARMAAGLAPIRGLFFFHTWPEVWIGRWVAVDPTRGEWPASAARIRFVTGDMEDLVSFTEIINQIEIEVLEVM